MDEIEQIESFNSPKGIKVIATFRSWWSSKQPIPSSTMFQFPEGN
jgi:hypothetical protein